jgi:uncharacterized protein (DUF1499 family)
MADSKLKQLWRGTDPAKPAKLAWAALILAGGSVLAVLAAGQAHRLGEMKYQDGFLVLRWAIGIAALGGILGIVSLVRARGARRRGWGPGVVAVILAVALIAIPAYYALWLLPRVPSIHDITTDLDNPPVFAAIVIQRVGYPNPAAYDGPEVAALQKQGYPDLAPIHLSKPPQAAFVAALDTVEAMGLSLVTASTSDMRIEASAHSLLSGLVDDVVIRIAPDGKGSRVDIRSKSREGHSDFGVNAARIRKMAEQLKARTA